jgi:hypothetical protein
MKNIILLLLLALSYIKVKNIVKYLIFTNEEIIKGLIIIVKLVLNIPIKALYHKYKNVNQNLVLIFKTIEMTYNKNSTAFNSCL